MNQGVHLQCASQEGVEALDPQLRQFSELPQWMKTNAERLEGRKVLMYCTGGVRCERATALLKIMGPGHQDVCQLQGTPTPRPWFSHTRILCRIIEVGEV